MTRKIELDRILDAKYWGKHGFPHAELQWLRENQPVWHCDGGDGDPFWLVTRHEDVVSISRNPKRWTSTERIMIEATRAVAQPARTMLDMDPPEHTKHRKVYQDWLKPRNVRQLEQRMRQISRELVDEMAQHDHGDFVEAIAAVHPLRMMCELLGVGREHEQTVLKLAKGVFGGRDPDHGGGEVGDGVDELVGFCQGLTEDRRARPSNDLASAVANAEIDGRRIDVLEAMSHILVLVTAGHDTTASAISGGFKALLDHPGELAKLQADPGLTKLAIEEMVRWTTPTTSFCRTATADQEICGVTIPKGEDVAMSFASANRDAEVFDAPFEFRVDRYPNPHLGYGTGQHACIGQMLARVEMQVLFEELIPRIRKVELADTPRWVDAIFISSLKRLPIRYELGPARD